MTQSLLLSIGFDANLLHIRNALLRQAGYHVNDAVSIEDALRVFKQGDFDLVVLCHTIPDTEKWQLIADLKMAKPMTYVLAIRANGQPESTEASIHSLDSPERLLEEVARLVRASKQEHSKRKAG